MITKKKKILFIWSKKALGEKKRIHWDWLKDCSKQYDIDLWGKGLTNISLQSLKNKIDSFKPDFIYMTNKNKYRFWLPDLSSIKNVKKIFVEVDSYKRKATADWYSQFDELYSRQPIWDFKQSVVPNYLYFRNINKQLIKLQKGDYHRKKINSLSRKNEQECVKRIRFLKTWKNIPLFRWSIPEDSIYTTSSKREGIYFLGRSSLKISKTRYDLVKRFENKIRYVSNWSKNGYNKILRSASALICPTESIYGDYVPAKLFEFLASGAAVITNCDLKQYQINDFSDKVIKYTNLDDLETKLSLDFTPYYNISVNILKNHIHSIRYKELFG